MKVDNEAFDFLMTLNRRAQIISDSKPADTIINMYYENWVKELTTILNKCTIIDNDGRVVRNPVK